MKAALQFASAIGIPLLALTFVISDRVGFFDWLLGHDVVLEVASRMETSYAGGVDRRLGQTKRPGIH